MARRVSCRRALYALACSLEVMFAACSGGSGDATAPDPGPPAHEPPPPAQEPPPPAQEPPPDQNPGITGTYVLIRINSNSLPGQIVSLANPDGYLIGLYRFEAGTHITLDAQQTFALDIRYSDDKGDYAIQDQGGFVNATPPGDVVGLTFSSAVYGDKFTGAAGDGLVGIKYDFDGDGRLDTSLEFQLVSE
jgi:hypothetical protein